LSTHAGTQVADWGPKIEKIVEWFGALQEVDVEGVPPALRPGTDEAGEGGSRLRADTPVEFAERCVRRAAGAAAGGLPSQPRVPVAEPLAYRSYFDQ
jgi:Asp-tRNA(Asn)/Glu-tRNA(Gln) amidotransferase C subunit